MGAPVPKDAADQIMHVALPVGNDILMASDAPESLGQKLVQGNHSFISVQVDSKEEADRVYKALSAGGKVHMPIGDQPWGDYYANFSDKFDIGWMISYTYPKKS